MFVTWKSLGSNVHVTKNEVEEATKVCTNINSTPGSGITSIPIDNAARHVV